MEVACEILYRFHPETEQDHIMVHVVLHVLDDHALEQYAICSKDVVCPRLDLSSVPIHSPCAPILQPRLTTWEKVQTHVHQPRRLKLVRNGLCPRCAFCLHQISIEISGHQKIGPVRLIPDGRIKFLYGRGVAGGNTTPHGIPPPPPCRHLGADDVQTMEAELLDVKVLQLAVEDRDAATMSARRRHHR